MNIKIIFSSSIFFLQKTGGISRYYTSLISNIKNKKVNFIVCAFINKNLYLKKIKKKFKISFYISRYPIFFILKKINQVFTKFICSIYKPDIFHETYYSINSPNINTKIRVITIYDLIHEKFYKNFDKKLKSQKKKLLDCYDHFICISKNTQDDFIKYYKVPKKKTSVIYLAGDHLRSIKKKPILNKIGKYLLYVGSRDNYKNFTTLVESVNKSDFYKDKKIVCFGGGPFSLSEIKSFKNAKNFIYVNGDDSNLKYLYSKAEALIITSLYEGFGITALEAMETGCPVVTTDGGSLKEVCKNSVLYFKKNDHNDLTKKIKFLLNSDKVKKKFINSGYKRRSYFTWKKCSQKTISLYKKLLSEN